MFRVDKVAKMVERRQYGPEALDVLHGRSKQAQQKERSRSCGVPGGS